MKMHTRQPCCAQANSSEDVLGKHVVHVHAPVDHASWEQLSTEQKLLHLTLHLTLPRKSCMDE